MDSSVLWVTPAQRDTINQAPDYRAGFGLELQFEMPWRYVKNNKRASKGFFISERESRNLDDSVYDFSALLYHELAHANDYFPTISWNITKGSSTSILTHVNDLFDRVAIQSDNLQRFSPLDENWDESWNDIELPERFDRMNTLSQLAQIRFRNPTLIEQNHKDLTTNDVANLFSAMYQGAPQFYS